MYNRRDQIGHWVRKDQQIYRPCKHACCRGYRAHPSNWPIIPASHALRRASDDQLAKHYGKVSADPSRQARAVELQIIHEFERRDRAETKRREKEQHRQAVAANKSIRRTEREGHAVRGAGYRAEAQAARGRREVITARPRLGSQGRAAERNQPRPGGGAIHRQV